jgi:hypothetical protein
MKYSIPTNTWTTVKSRNTQDLILIPEMDYYIFSNQDKLYTINPTTGALSAAKNIVGLHNTNGGDLAFARWNFVYVYIFWIV